MLADGCAMCGLIGTNNFVVEDLPVGPRWFCTEKHFAQYAGLPVKEFGYYGLDRIEYEDSGDEPEYGWEDDEYEAESKKRKRGFRKCSKCGDRGHNAPKCENPQYYEALARKEEMLDHVDYAIKEFTKDAKEYSLNRRYDMAKMRREDATDMRKLKRMIENNHFGKAWRFAFGLDSEPREYAPNALWDIWDAESFEMEGMLGNWEGKLDDEPVYCPNCKWDGLESDLVQRGGRYSSWICPDCMRKDWEYTAFNAESKKLPPVEKAIDTGIASGATMEGLDLALGAESFKGEGTLEPCPHDAGIDSEEVSWLGEGDRVVHITGRCRDCSAEGEGYVQIEFEDGERWKDDEWSAEEEPSVYWWIKGALMEKMKDDREVTIDDVENIILMVAANAPLNSIDKGMKEAEQLGDKTIWEMLKLAAIGRSEILTEDQIHSEKLRDFQAEEYTVADEDWSGRSCEDCYEEIKKGDLIHDDGYGILICKKCYSNYKIPCEHEACDERFKDKDEEREHRQETCNRCGGEGWVMTHYTPATYHDPADVDGEDCEECWGEGWVCDKFNAEDYPTTRPNCKCGATLEWDNTRKAWYCTKCPFNTYKAERDEPPEEDDPLESWMEDFDADSNGDITIRQQAIDTIEARVADYSTHEDVNRYEGNPNQYLYHKLRYAWGNHPEQREEIIQQYIRGIEDGRIDPSNPLPHGAPNQHLPSKWDAESFSAEGDECSNCGVVMGEDYQAVDCCGTTVCDKCVAWAFSVEGGKWDDLVIHGIQPSSEEKKAWDKLQSDGDVFCHKCLEKIIPNAYESHWAESFAAESNGDKQLDLAVKRTKMSAVRTGLAITTFALVMWNVWTNKKQEKDIADIMTLI